MKIRFDKVINILNTFEQLIAQLDEISNRNQFPKVINLSCDQPFITLSDYERVLYKLHLLVSQVNKSNYKNHESYHKKMEEF